MKKFWTISLVVLLVFFLGSLLFSLTSLFNPGFAYRPMNARPLHDEYDSSLLRLNTMKKLEDYCDSFYQANKERRTYPGVVSEVIRKRFYHGYSFYTVSVNPIGVLLEPLVKNGAIAIVIPDDIVKYAHAACSQQSIVGMEIFRRNGFPVRKVSMYDSVVRAGHFAFEVFYEKGWHYFDTNLEPDTEVLRRYKRPSVAILAKHPEIVAEAYRKYNNPELFTRLLVSAKLGAVDKFPAPNAILYQKVTKYISYFGWLWIVVIMLLRKFMSSRSTRKRETVKKSLRPSVEPVFSN